jgi:hypothetical protein
MFQIPCAVVNCRHTREIGDWRERDHARVERVVQNKIGEVVHQKQPSMGGSTTCNEATLGKINIVNLVRVKEMAELAGCCCWDPFHLGFQL